MDKDKVDKELFKVYKSIKKMLENDENVDFDISSFVELSKLAALKLDNDTLSPHKCLNRVSAKTCSENYDYLDNKFEYSDKEINKLYKKISDLRK